MDSHEARRVLEFRADVGELEARGIRGEERLRLRLRFELREQFALGLQILEDRLDDDVRLPGSVSGDVGNQPVERVPNYGFVAQPAFEKLGRRVSSQAQGARVTGLQRHREAAHRAPGGDISAMTPAPITWTRFALKSLPFPSDFRRSWRKKIRMSCAQCRPPGAR